MQGWSVATGTPTVQMDGIQALKRSVSDSATWEKTEESWGHFTEGNKASRQDSKPAGDYLQMHRIRVNKGGWLPGLPGSKRKPASTNQQAKVPVRQDEQGSEIRCSSYLWATGTCYTLKNLLSGRDSCYFQYHNKLKFKNTVYRVGTQNSFLIKTILGDGY